MVRVQRRTWPDRHAPRPGRRPAPPEPDSCCEPERRAVPLPRGLARAEFPGDDFQPLGALELGLAAFQKPVGVVGLDPRLQEFYRDRGPDRAAIEAFELQGMEPAVVDLGTEPCAQHHAHLVSLGNCGPWPPSRSCPQFRLAHRERPALACCLALCDPAITELCRLRPPPLQSDLPLARNAVRPPYISDVAASVRISACERITLAPTEAPWPSSLRGALCDGRYRVAPRTRPPRSGSGHNPPRPSPAQP